jgi:hypothetical protein
LELLDQAIEKFRIAAAKAIGEGVGIVGHEAREAQQGTRGSQRVSLCAHTTLYTTQLGKKTHPS